MKVDEGAEVEAQNLLATGKVSWRPVANNEECLQASRWVGWTSPEAAAGGKCRHQSQMCNRSLAETGVGAIAATNCGRHRLPIVVKARRNLGGKHCSVCVVVLGVLNVLLCLLNVLLCLCLCF